MDQSREVHLKARIERFAYSVLRHKHVKGIWIGDKSLMVIFNIRDVRNIPGRFIWETLGKRFAPLYELGFSLRVMNLQLGHQHFCHQLSDHVTLDVAGMIGVGQEVIIHLMPDGCQKARVAGYTSLHGEILYVLDLREYIRRSWNTHGVILDHVIVNRAHVRRYDES